MPLLSVVTKMDIMLQPYVDQMTALKEENKRLNDVIQANQVEREMNEQMRKELESQMNVCKGKVIKLQTENILLKADLDVVARAAAEPIQNENAKDKGNEKQKRMEHGLQKEKELQRKTRAQVLKAFNWTKESADLLLLAAACGFWDSFRESGEGKHGWRKKARVSKLDRMKA